MPAYEEAASYYRDRGTSDDFSLEGLTEGECSSGVIDMIESDLEAARQFLLQARDNDPDLSIVKKALLFSARALLVGKGSDPRGELDVVHEFVHKFVSTGICSPDLQNLGDVLKSLCNKTISRQAACDYASRLYREAIETYALMDSNFRFPVRYNTKQS